MLNSKHRNSTMYVFWGSGRSTFIPILIQCSLEWQCTQYTIKHLARICNRNNERWKYALRVSVCSSVITSMKFFSYRTWTQLQVMASPSGATRSHLLDTSHLVGLLWTSDQLDTEISTWQHTTFKRDKPPCPWQGLNPQSQQANSRTPKP